MKFSQVNFVVYIYNHIRLKRTTVQNNRRYPESLNRSWFDLLQLNCATMQCNFFFSFWDTDYSKVSFILDIGHSQSYICTANINVAFLISGGLLYSGISSLYVLSKYQTSLTVVKKAYGLKKVFFKITSGNCTSFLNPSITNFLHCRLQ